MLKVTGRGVADFWTVFFLSPDAIVAPGFALERSYTVETLCMNTTLGHCYNVSTPLKSLFIQLLAFDRMNTV